MGESEEVFFQRRRNEMIDEQISDRGIHDPNVLDALRSVPRHCFIEGRLKKYAYEDHPVAIGLGQTISQPYIVALMTEQLHIKPDDRVLEVGTGSGYQTAVLAEIAQEVYSLEIREILHKRAKRVLADLGYTNIRTYLKDGYEGLPEAAPFNCIIVTAAVPAVPAPLIHQLSTEGGRMVVPVNTSFGYQDLLYIKKSGKEIRKRNITHVSFVPLAGKGSRRAR